MGMQNWIKNLDDTLAYLRKLRGDKPVDRLSLVRRINAALNSLQNSIAGWNQWAKDPLYIADFDEATLTELADKITDFTIAFLEFDKKATERELQKTLPPLPPREKIDYVS